MSEHEAVVTQRNCGGISAEDAKQQLHVLFAVVDRAYPHSIEQALIPTVTYVVNKTLLLVE